MPAIITKGAFSAQGYGFGASAAGAATYIEDVFSTYLYTGTQTNQSIVNNIDLATKGGMLWVKARSEVRSNYLFNTISGTNKALISNSTAAETTFTTPAAMTSFNSNGFTLGQDNSTNNTGTAFTSWTFRKQPKFFDIVTYTGNGSTQTINHNLGSVPGMIIVKSTSANGNWPVYHTSLGNSQLLFLSGMQGAYTGRDEWNNTTPTSTTFSVKGSLGNTNDNGVSYVAYLFAHNAGGFGAAGTDNVISCGSYTGNGSATGPTVTLGYEPQYVMVKCTSTTGNWVVLDVMRGMSQTASNELFPNLTSAETALNPSVIPTATGFTLGTTNADLNTNGATYIYMAIRRGPMKTPTDATKVFSPVAYTGDNSPTRILTSGFPIDFIMSANRSSPDTNVFDRLRGVGSGTPVLSTASASVESLDVYGILTMNGLQTGDGTVRFNNNTGVNYVDYFFARAPGFFDEVCYTGTGDNQSVTHNLGVVPQLIIVKRRSGSSAWFTYNATSGVGKYLMVNDTAAVTTLAAFMSSVTSTAFVPSTNNLQIALSASGSTYVAYLFATLAGVSKVGSYTGTGAAQNIDCGFAASARFILIKRTDSTGGWYVYDSARGISASNDPYLLLNSTAAEVTNTDYVGTYASGFALTSTAPAALNASGGSYLFLAIA